MHIKRSLKYLAIADAASKLSNINQYSLGAVITANNEILSVSYNQKKSHPLQKKYNKQRHRQAHEWSYLHAELAGIIKVKNKKLLEGATIFVSRKTRDGRNANARPCAGCMAAIRDFRFRNIIYTTEEGYAEEILLY